MPSEMEADQIIEKLEDQISDLETKIGEKDERIRELLDLLAEAKGTFDDLRNDCANMIRDIERSKQ